MVFVADRDPRMADDAVLRWAVRDHRVIVTTDQDFEEMVWREGKAHEGILRLENLPRAERIRLLDDVLTHHREALEAGSIVIALNRKTRIRRPW